MANKQPADDENDWSYLLDDNLDEVMMEATNYICTSDSSSSKVNNSSQTKVTTPASIEVITIEDYDEEDDQLLQAIALSLQDSSHNNSGSMSSKVPDVQLLPSTSSTLMPSTSSKMSDADLAAITAALEELEHNFNTMQTVADEETLRTIELMEIADQLELEDQQKLESYNPTNAAAIRSLPIVHPDLEHLDPNPDIYQLYREFDAAYFQGFLAQSALRLDWAKNFYSVAGSYYPQKDGVPTILLSANLLTLRPRRDLVETLLHEMIHAYIDLKHLYDTSDHGSTFRHHMNRINQAAGTAITVYHNFHDEVSYLRKYIWRCSGSLCQSINPYRGYISLPTKRRPSKWDKAYRVHLERGCSGTFEQVSNNFQDSGKQKKMSKKD